MDKDNDRGAHNATNNGGEHQIVENNNTDSIIPTLKSVQKEITSALPIDSSEILDTSFNKWTLRLRDKKLEQEFTKTRVHFVSILIFTNSP